MSPTYEEYDVFDRDYFPDDWDGEDIEFLAAFVKTNFDARLLLDETADDPYVLFQQVDR